MLFIGGKFAGTEPANFGHADRKISGTRSNQRIVLYMKVLHLSPIYNRKSIFKHGIIPKPVREWHRQPLQKAGDCTKEGLGVYTTAETIFCEKYIKDHTYCCIFLHPRNNLIKDNSFNFRKVENKLLYQWDQMIFDIWEADVKDNTEYWLHVQQSTENFENSCFHFDDRFAHVNKPIYVWPYKLTEIKLVMQSQFYWNNRRAHIKVLNNIIY